jgi:hypothetical protein
MPHINLVLSALQTSRSRVAAPGKIAVDTAVMRILLQKLAELMPFDEASYLASYPDIRRGHERGDVTDLHAHFISTGYLEGRVGWSPEVDEAYYRKNNPDVAAAIQAGRVASASAHYVSEGAAEGRAPNAAQAPDVSQWLSLRPSLIRQA